MRYQCSIVFLLLAYSLSTTSTGNTDRWEYSINFVLNSSVELKIYYRFDSIHLVLFAFCISAKSAGTKDDIEGRTRGCLMETTIIGSTGFVGFSKMESEIGILLDFSSFNRPDRLNGNGYQCQISVCIHIYQIVILSVNFNFRLASYQPPKRLQGTFQSHQPTRMSWFLLWR